MADLQCLICEYVPPEDDLPQDEMLVLIGAGSSTERGRALLHHMSEHTLTDWVKAFKMADAYIAQLEGENEAIRRANTELQSRPVTTSAVPQFIPPADYGTQLLDGEPLAPNGQPLSRYLTPDEIARKRQQAKIRAQVEAADPNESLIPYIAPASRPEGVVGRKM